VVHVRGENKPSNLARIYQFFCCDGALKKNSNKTGQFIFFLKNFYGIFLGKELIKQKVEMR